MVFLEKLLVLESFFTYRNIVKMLYKGTHTTHPWCPLLTTVSVD